jgi:hypothetical protein
VHPAPDCNQRKALRERCRAAFRAYIDATDELDPMELGSKFDEAYNKATWARLAFESIREEYHRHTSEHGCT